MRYQEESVSFGRCLSSSILGGVLTLVFILLFSGLLSVVLLMGTIPESAMSWCGTALCALAALVGANAAVGRAAGRRLFVALGSAAASLALLALLRALAFSGETGSLLLGAAALLVGSVLAALLHGGGKRRRVH